MKRKELESDRSESKLDSLPLELKLDILTRLPAKSLLELQRVSKMWFSIIRSREFIRTFSSISSTRPRFIVALSNGSGNKVEENLVFFFSFEEEEGSTSLVPNFDMALPGVSFDSSTVSTSVHGFLAVQALNLTLCNPCTEQFRTFPDGTKNVGYDPIADQYKALHYRFTTKGRVATIVEHKVLTFGGGGGGWRHVEPLASMPHTPMTGGVSINGFIYYPTYTPVPPQNPGIVCFDVRSEKLTYIKTPLAIVGYGCEATYIEYKGKLAAVVADSHYSTPVKSIDLYVLEDVQKHQWSKTTCALPRSVWDCEWDFSGGLQMSFPGTNKAGEIIIAPRVLPRDVQPYYIFYYNVKTKKVRRVRLCGIGDNLQFRRSYGFVNKGQCYVCISPQHTESIVFFKNRTT